MKRLAAILISAVTAFAGVVPAQAFPVIAAPKVETSQPVERVQWSHGHYRNAPRYYRHHGSRYSRHGRSYRSHGRYYRNHGRYYGGRHWRRGHHGHAGAIIGGFAAGAIIGGALAQPRYAEPRRYVGGGSHVNWCYSRYRSYRAYDNTFQPYNGPRRQCYSPYR